MPSILQAFQIAFARVEKKKQFGGNSFIIILIIIIKRLIIPLFIQYDLAKWNLRYNSHLFSF